MCGIVGVISNQNVVAKILDGLKKLEYRGYDSAGIAVLKEASFETVKEEGKISVLESALAASSIDSNIGIGHTRWATHGQPSKENSHPHASSKVCVVHNGIIENHQELKAKLQKNGVKFLSETDTEVVPHLIEYYYEKTSDIKQSLILAAQEIQGTFALAIIFRDKKDLIAFAKRGSPLILGVGKGENYVASDYYALSANTDKIIALEDGEFGIISQNSYEVFDEKGNVLKKKVKTMEATKNQVSKDGFDHFMLKEIFEQPRVLEETVQAYVNLSDNSIHLPNFPFSLKDIRKVTMVACGTSYYAASCAKYLIEEIAKVEVEVDIASEFRYRSHPFREDNLMVFISQSGETADTIAALKYAKSKGQKVLSIVNVAHSSMAQLSDAVIRTIAGPEIGVASTKAYTAQIATLSLFAIEVGVAQNKVNKEQKQKLIFDLIDSGVKMNHFFTEKNITNIKKVAKSLTKAKHVLYIGRGISQITSFEAALKFRELSYINAQGIAAGELKHGTIALIDKKMPVIVIAPTNSLFEKTASNAQEVNARGGKIILISDQEGISHIRKLAKDVIEIPALSGMIQEALLPVISTQILAYFVALFKGNDVDQPRNLAKSVTVE
ncbi:MAG: glutamine--fructose-6-phosphate transaminase (isomerizing) [Pelagibacterales bacterium]|nr:glutamine--fructose-6-phosphate transaminase (isomerizing) [Pelagibacterales bacterium]